MNRRHFLKSTAVATGGLVLGFYLPDKLEGAAEPNNWGSKLNAWVHISSDDTVTLAIHKAEMGQGTVTSLAMLLAEELECDWNKIKTEFPASTRNWAGARRRGKPEYPHIVGFAPQNGSVRSGNACLRCSTKMERAGFTVPR